MPVPHFRSGEEARAALLALYGHPENDPMTPYERVETAVARRAPDRTPFDFWAVEEVVERLMEYLNAEDEEELLQLLGIDCRLVHPRYIGPKPATFADGSYFTPWGSHRRLIANEYSVYEEYASFPLAEADSVSEVQTWPGWPCPEYWDWASVLPQIKRLNAHTRYHIRYEVGGIFESAWALYGMERFLMDLVERPELPCAILDGYTDLMVGNVKRLAAAAGDKIDMVYTYDDVAIQDGLLMSPAMWRKHILPRHLRLNAAIKEAGWKIMYHSCGAIYPLIRPLIDEMGIAVLNPLQPRAKWMDMARIKAEFGQDVAFHGGIDLQHTMPHGTPEEVAAEAGERIRILGAGGGYICTTAHYIQNDVPIENILALYTAPRGVG